MPHCATSAWRAPQMGLPRSPDCTTTRSHFRAHGEQWSPGATTYTREHPQLEYANGRPGVTNPPTTFYGRVVSNSNRRASLEVLRAEAHEELDTVIHERLLAGEDPWHFMDELPTVDELVVYLLRADAIAAHDGQSPTSTREYRLLRQIALDHPALTSTVWRMLPARALRDAS